MGRNVELKARVEDADGLHARVAALADDGPSRVRQEDTFFRAPRGRLKLRRLDGGAGELIWYERPDVREPDESRYWIAPCAEPSALGDLLAAALGVRGVVSKTRTLFRVGQTRVHLDRVEGLGEFVELEVVLEPEQTRADGVRVARALMEALRIDETDLVACAYIDLLEAERPRGGSAGGRVSRARGPRGRR